MKVLDAKGVELDFGSRVATKHWGECRVTGFSTFTHNATGATVFVLPYGEREEMPWHAAPAATPDIFRCPDLIALPSTERTPLT